MEQARARVGWAFCCLDAWFHHEAGQRGRDQLHLIMPQRFGDIETLQATYADFKPAVPATMEGAVTAGLGYFGGWALVGMLGRMLALMFRRRVV